MTGSARLELPADLDGPGNARSFVTDQLQEWGYGSVASDAALLTSELVTNAIRHAEPPYAVEVVEVQDGVRVTVEDAGLELPGPGYPGPEAVSGRGLGIVETVAAEWGAQPITDQGKAVWFRLAAPDR